MKYKVKIKVCITLLMMLLLISGTAFAKDDFRILETQNSDGTITRVYEKDFRRYNISDSDFYRDSYAGFNGAAAKLYLPKDIYNNESTSMVYSDYKAHFQFDARVQYPNQTTYFDSIGTYDHLRYEIGFEPGIEIGKDGGSFSIGLALSNGNDKRSVPLQLYYQP